MSDVSRHVVREVYCEVLFEMADQMGQIEDVLGDLSGVAQIFEDEAEFASVMDSQTVRGEEKAEIVRRVFKGKISNLTLDFLIVLARRNRMGLLTTISHRYEMLVDAYKQRTPMEVVVANAMGDEQRHQLRDRLCAAIGGEVKLEVIIDPNIIGGIIIRRGERVIDHSVRSALLRAIGRVA